MVTSVKMRTCYYLICFEFESQSVCIITMHSCLFCSSRRRLIYRWFCSSSTIARHSGGVLNHPEPLNPLQGQIWNPSLCFSFKVIMNVIEVSVYFKVTIFWIICFICKRSYFIVVFEQKPYNPRAGCVHWVASLNVFFRDCRLKRKGSDA